MSARANKDPESEKGQGQENLRSKGAQELLLVDDERDNRAILGRFLARQGYRLREAENGEQALAILEAGASGGRQPDMVLLDCMMPGLNGLAVLRKIRESHSRATLPVLMLTTQEDTELIAQCLQAGANDFITRPIDWRIAFSRIQAQLERLNAHHKMMQINRSLETQVQARTRALRASNRHLRREIARCAAVEEELRTAKRAAEQANDVKSAFLANMSHELRTPLNAVIGFSDIIRNELMGAITPPAYREYAEDINRSAVHLLGIVNNLLDMVRLSQNDFTPDPVTIDLAEFLESVMLSQQHNANERDVSMVLRLPRRAVKLVADQRLLNQAMANIINNALKFTLRGGRVIVNGASEDGEAIISVCDEGIGMDQEMVDAMMEPFAQAGEAYTRSAEGVGLGLPIASCIVGLHGGRIALRSTAGEGTEVSVRIPLDGKAIMQSRLSPLSDAAKAVGNL